jgi:hypothetical protein
MFLPLSTIQTLMLAVGVDELVAAEAPGTPTTATVDAAVTVEATTSAPNKRLLR